MREGEGEEEKTRCFIGDEELARKARFENPNVDVKEWRKKRAAWEEEKMEVGQNGG